MNNKQVVDSKNFKAHFIDPMDARASGYFGVEIELPIISLDQSSLVAIEVKQLLLQLADMFKMDVVSLDTDGFPLVVVCSKTQDKIAFEYSFTMLEISLAKSKDINLISKRMDQYLKIIQDYLAKYSYTLAGMGSHPFMSTMDKTPLKSIHYEMLRHFMRLREPNSQHYDIDFFSFINATQIHLDSNVENIPQLFRVFSKLDWVRAALFSNSIVLDKSMEPEQNCFCCRDLYYESSVHGLNCSNLGSFDIEHDSVEQLIKSFMHETSLWYVIDQGHRYFFKPIFMHDYFSRTQIDGFYINEDFKVTKASFTPKPEHIQYFKGFKNITFTQHKTIELRGFCTQSFDQLFSPVAFTVGCYEKMNEVEAILDNFSTNLSNNELRRLVTSNNLNKIDDPSLINCLIKEILSIAEQGLIDRNLGEEKFLQSLIEQDDYLKTPAAKMINALNNGATVFDIIHASSSLT
ncbi:hypothetical protein [Cysteiniphilum halobium]|uniref:hypothetical protein n=1 Tax=Cysteiniphilum halobium TaxID=2219059 RepID=UPI003F826746